MMSRTHRRSIRSSSSIPPSPREGWIRDVRLRDTTLQECPSTARIDNSQQATSQQAIVRPTEEAFEVARGFPHRSQKMDSRC